MTSIVTSGQQVDNNGAELLGNDSVEQSDTPPLVNVGTPPKESCREELGELPGLRLYFDLLYLIFSACHPRDLLSVVRTCKSIRGVLISKSSAFIWRTARSQVEGMPDCPDDLSEPAYASLVFYPYCQGCGNRASRIFWSMRRRYCKKCTHTRFCHYGFFPRITWAIITKVGVHIKGKKDAELWVEKDQIDTWVKEYEHSSDKKGFLAKKRKHYGDIALHAVECARWQEQMASKRKDELAACLRERERSILDQLKQLGYEREINYFGPDCFRDSCREKALKKAPKLLTDREWKRILPWWLKTMNQYRQIRLGRVVFLPRWETLVFEYDRYVARRSQDTPASFDLLPNVTDLTRFPPFRDIIEAPEDTALGEDLFAPAFAQLPALVDDWRKQLEAELAKLVEIPSDLVSGDTSTSCGSGAVSKDKTHTEDSDKLRLACAVFQHYDDSRDPLGVICAYPEIFFVSESFYYHSRFDERTGSIYDRFQITFLEEAPYVIHACGLDPNVATPDDMDRRDARLRCLCCKKKNPLIMNWRDAMMHAREYHLDAWLDLEPLSESPRWRLVSDEYIDVIRAAEPPKRKSSSDEPESLRCLLCLPRVGDVYRGVRIRYHLLESHNVKKEEVQRGVHFAYIGWDYPSAQVEMIEEGQVIFRKVTKT